MFRFNSNPLVFCCMIFPFVKSYFPILGLCNCLFGTLCTFLICIFHYLNSIFKHDPSFQLLEIFQNLVLIEFGFSSQLCDVPKCDKPAFQVWSCWETLNRSEERALKVRCIWILQGFWVPCPWLLSPDFRSAVVDSSWLAPSSRSRVFLLLFCSQAFSQAKGDHLVQAQHSLDAGEC